MIKEIADFYSEETEVISEGLLSVFARTRDLSRGKLQALEYLQSICVATERSDLVKKLEEDTFDVFHNKLLYAINKREERIWISAIKNSITYRQTIIDILHH